MGMKRNQMLMSLCFLVGAWLLGTGIGAFVMEETGNQGEIGENVVLDSENLGEDVASDSEGILESEEGVDLDEITVPDNGITILIDPGHGGEDPGKVGITGVLEKDLNLQISLLLRTELEARGYEIVMTRETDENICEGEGFSKAEDLKNRVLLMNQIEPALVVSIHQNSYTTPDIRGAQVFYYVNSEQGKTVAQFIQEELWGVDSEAQRQIASNDTYYLLTRSLAPTVIIECGFLSNEQDSFQLEEPSYQKELVVAIADGIDRFYE